MRGDDAISGSLFSYIDLEKRVSVDHPLRVIREVANAALKSLSRDFDALYSPIGRESIPPERLMRALLLQAFYSIRSERQLIERIDYDLLVRWFVGLGIEEQIDRIEEKIMAAPAGSRGFAIKFYFYVKPDCDDWAPENSTLRWPSLFKDPDWQDWEGRAIASMFRDAAQAVPELAEHVAPIIDDDAALIDAEIEIGWCREGGYGVTPNRSTRGPIWSGRKYLRNGQSGGEA